MCIPNLINSDLNIRRYSEMANVNSQITPKNLGLSCQHNEDCEKHIPHSYCSTMKQCVCKPYYYQTIDGIKCEPSKIIGEICQNTIECLTMVDHSICHEKFCKCEKNYSSSDTRIHCVPEEQLYQCIYEGRIWTKQLERIKKMHAITKAAISREIELRIHNILKNYIPDYYVTSITFYREDTLEIQLVFYFKTLSYNATYDISNYIVLDFNLRSKAIGGKVTIDHHDINLISKGELCVIETPKEIKFEIKSAALAVGLILLFFIIVYIVYRAFHNRKEFDPLIYVPWKQSEFRKILPIIPADKRIIVNILDQLDVLPPKFYNMLNFSTVGESVLTQESNYADKKWIELAKCYLNYFYWEYYDFDYNYKKYDLQYDYDAEVLHKFDWRHVYYRNEFEDVDVIIRKSNSEGDYYFDEYDYYEIDYEI
ncbi:unnamed protein product [Gordionus sp. m RMFG-2023]